MDVAQLKRQLFEYTALLFHEVRTAKVYSFSSFFRRVPSKNEFLSFFWLVRRDFWMSSSLSFSNCKMRTTRTLLWRWCHCSLMTLRGCSMSWPKHCEIYFHHPNVFQFSNTLFNTSSPRIKSEKFMHFLSFPFCMFRDQQNIDFKKVDAHVHQLKGSSSRYSSFSKDSSFLSFSILNYSLITAKSRAV